MLLGRPSCSPGECAGNPPIVRPPDFFRIKPHHNNTASANTDALTQTPMLPLNGCRILIYDNTCLGSKRWLPGLTHSWVAGKHLYQTLHRFDRAAGFSDWTSALEFLATIAPHHPIQEIQFWGHGKWGRVMIAGEALTVDALQPQHPWYNLLCQIRSRLTSPDALWWFRTCETFGASKGHEFASQWATFFGCRVAGHTQVIGPWQAGLHAVKHDQEPFWAPSHGLIEGTPDAPLQSAYSRLWHPRTISCLQVNLPPWSFLP